MASVDPAIGPAVVLRGRDTARSTALPRSYFGAFVLFLLCGYALLGKGFAYAGVPPVFIGEVGVLLALATFVHRFHSGIFRSPVSCLALLFMMWGAICTLPYIGRYGIDAPRDGVVWGYAIYALAVATVLIRFRLIASAVAFYGRAMTPFLLLAPLCIAMFWMFESLIPRWPWGPSDGVSMVHVKAGDIAVHYAGICAFVMLGLSRRPIKARWMLLWCAGVIPVVFVSRGAFVTVACVMLLVAVFRPTLQYSLLLLGALTVIVLLSMTGMQIDPGFSSGRVISVDQFLENIKSIFFPGNGGDTELQGTRLWRQLWWDKIVGYTFFGEHFWSGKGFGINLADADGFQVADGNLRSPHNIHLTILARMGVPGFVLWVSLNLSFAGSLILNFLRDRRAGRQWLANVELWTVLYWLAFIVNASFDVFIEGPQGGIWFWCVLGFGTGLLAVRRHMADAGFPPGPARVSALAE